MLLVHAAVGCVHGSYLARLGGQWPANRGLARGAALGMRRYNRRRPWYGSASRGRACCRGLVSSFDERRRARSGWPIRAIRLADEPLVDDRDTSSVDERLALVWTLTRQLWAFSGQSIPDYSRAETPGEISRPE